jgi:FAD/FMN-containing dehydrogenase
MQPKYGLAADNVLEYDVILANGSALTINACQHADLFWAMRGGGGGTYAVVTSMTSRIYPTLPLHFVQAMIQLSDPLGSDARAAMKDMVVNLGTEQPRLSEAGLAGYNFLGETSLMTAQIVADAEPGIMNRTFGSFVDRIRNDTRYNITMLEVSSIETTTLSS